MKIAALDIGGTAVKSLLYTGQPVSQKEVSETPTNAFLGAEALMQTVQKILKSMGSFDRIAVSTAGQVNPVSGTILFATENLPGYTGTPVKRLLEEAFGVPVTVENDVNAAALGEAYFGAGKPYDSFLCLTYGTGIGGAIVQNGSIYHGASCAAGEFGHILTHAGGLPCTCGGHGCYEAYASAGALCRRVQEETGLQLSGREVFARLPKQPQLYQIVQDWIEEILWGLVSLIHAWNPPCVVLGGGIMNEPLILDRIRQKLPQTLMPNHRAVHLEKAALGNMAGLLGAVHLAEK